MAHGKQPRTVSRIRAPSPSSCPGAASQEEQRGLVKKATQQTSCSLKDHDDDQLTPPVSAKHYYPSCDPSPGDMEDAGSEYDNVGSDVEQDYDEVLRVNARYYKQHCPEDTKHTEGDGVTASSAANAAQVAPRSRHSTKKCEGSQSDAKPDKVCHRFMSHRGPIAGGEAEEGAKEVQADSLFYSDGDELKEVLDGARFIEDLDESENNVQRPASLYQADESEKIRKGSQEIRREDDPQVTRNHNNPGAGRRCESSHMGPKEKERQGKGRGRRGAGGASEHIVSGIQGCVTNNAERPKTLSKECKRSVVRSKDRPGSSKHHHHHPLPPRHPHPQSPTDTQKTPSHRESPPSSGHSPVASDSQEIESRAIKPPLAPHHMAEEQKESHEEQLRAPEEPELGEEPSTTMMPEEVPEEEEEQPSRPEYPEFVPAEESNSPKVEISFKNRSNMSSSSF